MSSVEIGSSAPARLDQRGADALRSYMTVLEDLPEVAGDSERFAVVSDSGAQYIVDRRAATCTCHDMLHRRPDEGCKHLQRVAFATGLRPIPEWVDLEDVDDQLGEHVSAAPRVAQPDGSTEVLNQ